MSKQKGEKKKGPSGGVRHQPGRGHDTKSGIEKTKRFARQAAKKRAATQEIARKQWEQWDKLTEEQKKFLPKLRPKLPRPENVN